MTPRWLALALISAGCASSPAPSGTATPKASVEPGRNEPIPTGGVTVKLRNSGIYHYALMRRDSIVAQMPSGESQTQVTGRSAFVTVFLSTTSGLTRVTFTLDSIQPDADVTLAPEGVDSALHTRWEGRLGADGKLSGMVASKRSTLGDLVRDQLLLLFPITPDAGVASGQTWTAIDSAPARLSVVETVEQASIQGSAGSVTTGGGRGTLPITIKRTTTASGSTTTFEQPMDLTATGVDDLTYSIALDGQVLRVEGTSVRNMTLTVRAVGQQVPAVVTSALTMELAH